MGLRDRLGAVVSDNGAENVAGAAGAGTAGAEVVPAGWPAGSPAVWPLGAVVSDDGADNGTGVNGAGVKGWHLYTSPSPRD